MSRVPGIVYPCIATQLIKQVGFSRKKARTGAVTVIQRFGSALHLNVHFHMLFLDGVSLERPDGSLLFCRVKAPTSAELTRLAHTIAHRACRFLERQGLLERDMENSYLASDSVEGDPHQDDDDKRRMAEAAEGLLFWHRAQDCRDYQPAEGDQVIAKPPPYQHARQHENETEPQALLGSDIDAGNDTALGMARHAAKGTPGNHSLESDSVLRSSTHPPAVA